MSKAPNGFVSFEEVFCSFLGCKLEDYRYSKMLYCDHEFIQMMMERMSHERTFMARFAASVVSNNEQEKITFRRPKKYE